jgi:phosphoglycolate phosphatase
MKQTYATRWNIKTRIYDGIESVLTQLKNKGFSLSVLSNKIHQITIETVHYYFKNVQFDLVIGAGQFKKKPDPQAAFYIAKNIGFDTSEFLYVGDSGVDMRTAVSAGMHSAGALWGFREKTELMENGAEYLLTTPLEIISVLNQIG